MAGFAKGGFIEPDDDGRMPPPVLERGCVILPAAAVRKYGLDFLERLNRKAEER